MNNRYWYNPRNKSLEFITDDITEHIEPSFKDSKRAALLELAKAINDSFTNGDQFPCLIGDSLDEVRFTNLEQGDGLFLCEFQSSVLPVMFEIKLKKSFDNGTNAVPTLTLKKEDLGNLGEVVGDFITGFNKEEGA